MNLFGKKRSKDLQRRAAAGSTPTSSPEEPSTYFGSWHDAALNSSVPEVGACDPGSTDAGSSSDSGSCCDPGSSGSDCS